MRFALYDRRAAVLYAHRWAYGRNPAFYDYEGLGGDCTNFASQCIYAGSGVMNFTPTFGWYYIDSSQKAPAWTGVPYLYNFLTRGERSAGPVARPCDMEYSFPLMGRAFAIHRWLWLWGVRHRRRISSSRPTAMMRMTGLYPPMNIRTSAS